VTRASRSRWLGIELRHLAALAAVAREGSFRAAADSLGYVQSAVSQQVAHLEEVVGARLVDRRRGVSPVALTEAGELVLRHGEEILARIAAAQADVEVLRAGRAGELRVGVSESAAAALMPDVLGAFGRRLPGVTVVPTEAPAGDLAAAVARGALELAFGDLPLPAGPFQARAVCHDPHVLLAPARWPIATAGAPPEPEELAAMPLIAGPGRDRIDAELHGHGVAPTYACTCRTHRAVQALVAAGIGAAIVPVTDADPGDDRTATVALDGLLGPRALALYWHRDRRLGSAAEAFIEVVAAVATTPRPGTSPRADHVGHNSRL
jgi:DNA-binding transcriptional LysR family regulator